MKDLMVDIETLDTSSTAVITQIGACFFDRYTGEVGDKFLENISIQSCVDMGLTINGNTIEWWFKQPNRSWLENPKGLETVLNNFRQFSFKKYNFVWSHSSFDIPIIANAYYVMGQSFPFNYRSVRDIRTLVDLAGLTGQIKAKTTGEKDEKTHNGLDDCIYQVEYCSKCFNVLKG